MDQHRARKIIGQVQNEAGKWLIGIDQAIGKAVMALFTLVPYTAFGEKKFGQAHILLLDVPGVGKTDLARSLSFAIGASCGFIDGHPELLKSEIVGTEVWNAGLGKFFLRKGPIFNHIIIYDEINRTPPKGQTAFLQSMEERMVILEETDSEKGELTNRRFSLYPINPDLDDPNQDLFFWVMATANPIEQEGTYTLPEAQLDRFTFAFRVGFPPRDAEKRIRAQNVCFTESNIRKKIVQIVDLKVVLEISHMIRESVRTTDLANEYIMRLIENSRPFSESRKFATGQLKQFIDDYIVSVDKESGEGGGLSPRTNFHFEAGSRTHAFLQGRDAISIEDVKAVAHLIMDHRIISNAQAIGSGVSKKQIVKKILNGTKVPP